MAHIKIFYSSSGIDKHFIGNTLCNSDNSVLQSINILHFFTVNNITNPPENIQMKNKVVSHFFFEEPLVWCLVTLFSGCGGEYCLPMGTVFQLDDAPPHLSHCVLCISGQGVFLITE
jgi:hypothetical protein